MKQQSSTNSITHLSIIDNGIIVFLLFLLATIPAAIYGHIPAWGIIKYLFFSVFSVFLPGWLIQQKLNISLKDGISHIFVSFAIGFSLNVLIYAILLLLNMQMYSAYFVYGEAITAIVAYILLTILTSLKSL